MHLGWPSHLPRPTGSQPPERSIHATTQSLQLGNRPSQGRSPEEEITETTAITPTASIVHQHILHSASHHQPSVGPDPQASFQDTTIPRYGTPLDAGLSPSIELSQQQARSQILTIDYPSSILLPGEGAPVSVPDSASRSRSQSVDHRSNAIASHSQPSVERPISNPCRPLGVISLTGDPSLERINEPVPWPSSTVGSQPMHLVGPMQRSGQCKLPPFLSSRQTASTVEFLLTWAR